MQFLLIAIICLGFIYTPTAHSFSRHSYVSLFTDDNAGVLAAHLYGAGTETTSTALSWALLYSLLHPSVIQRAQAEIDSVIG